MFFHPVVWQWHTRKLLTESEVGKVVIWHQDCNAKTPSMILAWVTSSSAWAHKFYPPHEDRFSVPLQFCSAGDNAYMEKGGVPNAQASWATFQRLWRHWKAEWTNTPQPAMQEPAASYLNRWEKEESSHRTDSTTVWRKHGTHCSLGSIVLNLWHPTSAGIQREQQMLRMSPAATGKFYHLAEHTTIKFSFILTPHTGTVFVCMFAYSICSGFPTVVSLSHYGSYICGLVSSSYSTEGVKFLGHNLFLSHLLISNHPFLPTVYFRLKTSCRQELSLTACTLLAG